VKLFLLKTILQQKSSLWILY